jgi:carbon-monoxide dehydrogenase medium subunit
MKRFDYLTPKSVEEAYSFLSDHKEEAKIIAGGQSLIPQLKLRVLAPKFVVDIKNLTDLEYIRESQDSLKIGALTTHRRIETSEVIKKRFPVLVEMEHRLSDVQIRNWGTLGGNLCHADPAGDPAPVLVALGTKVKAVSARGERTIALGEFCINYLTTVLEPDEILTEIEVPYPPSFSGAAYRKETVRAADFPIASVAAVVSLDGEQGRVKKARIVLGGVGKTPVEAIQAEQVLAGEKAHGKLAREAGKVAANEIRPIADVHGSEEYKRKIVELLTEEIVSLAIKRAQET